MNRCPRACDVALAMCFLLGSGRVWAEAPAQRELQLDVFVNTIDTQQVAAFTERDGQLYAAPAELASFGISAPAARNRDGLIALSSIPGLTAQLDEKAQTVYLTVPIGALAPQTVALPVHASRPESGPPGLLINYDVSAQSDRGRINMFGAASARLFGNFGVVQYDAALTRSQGKMRVVRLNTTYTYSDPEHLRSYAVGDVISGALPYTRALRLGGVQVATNFALRPDLITFPLPAVSGGAAVPSTVDVLVNGVRQLSSPVAAGPFTIPQLPVVAGAGTISVQVRDAAGRQTVQTSSFYVSSDLLRPGLNAISAEVGAIRTNFGATGGAYGPLAISLIGRRGLTNYLTIEGHFEGSGQIVQASAGATVRIGKLGIISGAAGLSSSQGHAGGQIYGAIERSTNWYHLGASALVSTPSYRDLGSLVGGNVPRHQIQAFAGVSQARLGSLGIAYTDINQGAAPILPGVPLGGGVGNLQSPYRTSILSATYSRNLFGRAYAYVTGYRELGRGGTGSIMARISFSFGHRTLASASYDSASHLRTIEASRPEVDTGDIGWRVYNAQGSSPRSLGEVRYRSTFADVGIGVDHFNGQTYVQGNARGSVVFFDKALVATNTIYDSFAVVDTNGMDHVAVSLANRPVGRTNKAGRLLVPGLVAYQPNKLAIDPLDLPMDAQWDRAEARVIPASRTGAIVQFDVKRVHPLLLTVRTEDGALLTVGSTIQFPEGPELVGGFDGQVFIPDTTGLNQASAALPDGRRCTFELPRASSAFEQVKSIQAICITKGYAIANDSIINEQ